MDQEKIGSFIASCRREQGLTQRSLAEALNITDRAVSKWETGRSMPDPSLMLPLCELLDINVNELLSGERLDMENYKAKAEENLLLLKQQEGVYNRKLLNLEWVIAGIGTAGFLVMIYAAAIAVEDIWWKAALIAVGCGQFAVATGFALWLEQSAGYYECPNCGERYVPTMRAVVMAPHMGRSRKMKCPCCGERGYHKKVLTK